MDAPDSRQATDTPSTESEVVVSCHETKPGRRVFTERGNADGWISSDLVVELSR
ncbi:hypothetical protein Halru_1510 [Halovivax ruber XH-70]|uniref:Uncharacterized protein n=2 Tax=Halovivax TaxID=332951 RepID=L0IBC0_HALRX|nr:MULTISPECIES: hypothetical protein [Halovivax]AGB16118.1 hypothetical protein Halru_1510 [Halovivax ruber XH-70]ELZ14000.1 hypothetical protein C479_01076 [Halovivax asiaticus JCM 14624]